jgi:hypothetical protein
MAVTIGVGGGANIMQNDTAITSSTTLTAGSNYASIGPITINNGVTLTVNSGVTFRVI